MVLCVWQVTDTPEKNNSGTPSTKVLPFDPRSPTAEVRQGGVNAVAVRSNVLDCNLDEHFQSLKKENALLTPTNL